MGSGTWSPNNYQVRIAQQRATGKDDFAYSTEAGSVHPTLNPRGLEIRESRDSTEHPNSNAIIVGLDVSGSMGRVVRAIHAALPQLFKLLQGYNYIPHPQILFSAFSNGTCDVVPLQVAQFESDNRMDIHLENMIIGGKLASGCDPLLESSELIFYTAARHTQFDAWEKRQHKGYVFLITDEMAYDAVKKDEILKITGSKLDKDIPLDAIIAEARERYHLYLIIPTSTGGNIQPQVLEFWKSHLGPANVILLEDPSDISTTMALTIGLTERTIDLGEGLGHLTAAGASGKTVDAMAKALALVAGQSVKGTGSGLSDMTSDDGHRGARRL